MDAQHRRRCEAIAKNRFTLPIAADAREGQGFWPLEYAYMQVCPHDLCLVARKFLLIRGNLVSGQSFHVISRCRACCVQKIEHAFAWTLILYGISSMTEL